MNVEFCIVADCVKYIAAPFPETYAFLIIRFLTVMLFPVKINAFFPLASIVWPLPSIIRLFALTVIVLYNIWSVFSSIRDPSIRFENFSYSSFAVLLDKSK